MTKISESNRRIKYRNSFGLIKNSLTGLIIRECISKDLEIIEVLMEVSDLENKIGQEQGKSFLYIFLVGLFSLVKFFNCCDWPIGSIPRTDSLGGINLKTIHRNKSDHFTI